MKKILFLLLILLVLLSCKKQVPVDELVIKGCDGDSTAIPFFPYADSLKVEWARYDYDIVAYEPNGGHAVIKRNLDGMIQSITYITVDGDSYKFVIPNKLK
jgi:hypothetical protein